MMYRVIPLTLALTLTAASVAQNSSPARIRVGDELSVYVLDFPDIKGNFIVQADGAVYLPRVGRLAVAGLTVSSAQRSFVGKLATFLKKPVATLSLKAQRPDKVYVIGGKGTGSVDLLPETDLRQVYAESRVEENTDQLVVKVFRDGKNIASEPANALTTIGAKVWNGPLKGGDIVIIEPKPSILVWVVGAVQKPGRVRLEVGSDVYQAIASGGELAPFPVSGPAILREEMRVTVRRGDQEIPVALTQASRAKPFKLEDGDTISVQLPQFIRVTVTGQVNRPGEIVAKEGTPLAALLASAGGVTPSGTLKSVLVFHRGETRYEDILAGSKTPNPTTGPALGEGDVVYVQDNTDAFYVFGSAEKKGRYLMRDSRKYRLADAVAEAGGSTSEGSLSHVVLVRRDSTGKMSGVEYRLDKYIKDGDEASNPLISPNDIVFIGKPTGLSWNGFFQTVSSALLLQNLIRR